VAVYCLVGDRLVYTTLASGALKEIAARHLAGMIFQISRCSGNLAALEIFCEAQVLAISKSIVESQGGRIWAHGDGGRGATFHFTLPAAPAETKPQWMPRESEFGRAGSRRVQPLL
jgi:hypothetical protein